MRTIQDIQDEIIAAKEAQPELAALDSDSKVSIWRLWTYVVAVSIWALENVLDISIKQQNDFISQVKIHSFSWYSDLAKKFQFGTPLPELPWGEVEYDNTGLSDSDIEAMQVIKFASASKTPGGIMIKIAGLVNNDLAVVPPVQFDAFKNYMFRVSAAGDNLFYTNQTADDLKLELVIYYDPLVLNSQGKRLDGSNDTPVQQAIEEYIKRMDFDALFVPTFLIDELQQVEGVKIPDLTGAWSKYGSLGWMGIPATGVNPFAGYLRINDPGDLVINYIPQP